MHSFGFMTLTASARLWSATDALVGWHRTSFQWPMERMGRGVTALCGAPSTWCRPVCVPSVISPVAQSVADVEQMVADYAESRIDHILAIRGDMLGGAGQPWVAHPWGLPNATELVRLVKWVHPEACIGREGA